MSAPAAEQAAPPAAAVLGEPDLWCTYAAVRTLARLGRIHPLVDVPATAAYLESGRNADGGYAWRRGMASDAWATFYSTQALRDLGRPVPAADRTSAWLRRTWTGDAWAMTPGQPPDVWATHFSTRSTVDLTGADVPDRGSLLRWLAALQTPEGGLSWSPEHGTPDARACHYGVSAWQALNQVAPVAPPWDVERLTGWLLAQQDAGGGYRFSAGAEVPCLWATYRSVAALDGLRRWPTGPEASRAVERFLRQQRGDGGGYRRWPGYPAEDVWAAFCAVGVLRAAGGVVPAGQAARIVAAIGSFACAAGGFTYREPAAAADTLTAAAAVLGADGPRPALVAWLESCQLPNEGGVMYMPGRGAEVRCTGWALAAGAFHADPAARERITGWLRSLQNPDGGFGYWEGRGSDLVSTAAAIGALHLLGRAPGEVLDAGRLARFVDAAPAGTLRSAAQILRVRAALGRPDPAAAAALLARHQVRGGGFADTGNRVPDLLSTYEAVLLGDVHGLPVDATRLDPLLDRIHTPAGTGWTPLGPPDGGPLARGLGVLLRRRASRGPQAQLPPVTLS